LVRTNNSPALLAAVILPHIIAGEWEVVALLAVQIQSKFVEGAADALLEALFLGEHSSEEWFQVHRFAASCCGAIVPSPQTTREVASRVVKFVLSLGEELRGFGLKPIGELIFCLEENRSYAWPAVERTICQHLSGVLSQESEVAAEVIMHPEFAVESQRLRGRLRVTEWQEVCAGLCKVNREFIRTVARRSLAVCRDACDLGMVSVSDLLEWHGRGAPFEDVRYRSGQEGASGNVVGSILKTLLWCERDPQSDRVRLEKASRDLAALAPALETFCEAPLDRSLVRADLKGAAQFYDDTGAREYRSDTPKGLAGFCSLLLISMVLGSPSRDELNDILPFGTIWPILRPFRSLYEDRALTQGEEVEECLRGFELTDAQRAVICRIARNDLSLVK
jgi:hypothetical protein